MDTTDKSLKGSNDSYTGNCDITSGGVTWNVSGNTKMNPWRVGGKNLSATDRAVYTKTAFAKSVSEVKLTVGTANSITVNSLKLIVASDADFNTIISTVPATFAASSTISFVPETGSWSNAFYKFVFNVSVSGSSNKFVQFSKVEFYEAAATGVLTSLSYSGSPALQKTGEAFNAEGLVFSANYDDGDARDVTSEVTFNPATISSDTTVVKATYETVSCDIPVKVKGDLTSIDCEGTPSTQFIGKAFNPTGLTFTAYYGALNEEIAHEEMAFSPEVITADTEVVTASFGGKTVDITGFTVEELRAISYSKLTQIEDLKVGSQVVFANGDGSKLMGYYGEGNNIKAVDSGTRLSGSNIVVESEVDADIGVYSVEKGTVDGTFAFRDMVANTYLYAAGSASKGSNYLKTKTTLDASGSFSVSLTSSGLTVKADSATANSKEIRFNPNNNPPIFSCYASRQEAVSMYVYNPVLSEKGNAIVSKLLNDLDCDGGVNAPSVETWNVIGTAFADLPYADRAMMKSAKADVAGSELEQAMAKYDYIVAKYTAYEDFIGREPAPAQVNNVFSNMAKNDQTMIALIGVLSLGVAAAGAYFFSKKRKSVR